MKDTLVAFVERNSGLTLEQIKSKSKQVGIVPGSMRGVLRACIDDGKLSTRGFRPLRVFPAGQGDGLREQRLAEERARGKGGAVLEKVNGVEHSAAPLDLLVTFPIGNGESMTMTFTEAKRLRDQLVAAFR
jgi:hypothetical protein